MEKRPRYIYFLLALLVMLSSCDKKEADSGNMSVLCPIEFGAEYSAQVKASELTSGNISSFGVFAALEDDEDNSFVDVDVDRLELFMDDVPVRKTSSGWLSDPVYYWPFLDDKHISFFAYAPHSAGTGIVASAHWGTDVAGMKSKSISISYTMDADPSRHVDLCVASVVADRVKDEDYDGVIDPVALEFHHTLASVTFAANYVGDVPDGCYLRIDELTLSNFVNTNTMSYRYGTGGLYEWDDIGGDSPKDGTAMLNISRSTLSSSAAINRTTAPGKGDYTDFLTLNGVIYMLPQEINPIGTDDQERTKVDITFSYVRNDLSNAVTAQFYTSMTLPVETSEKEIVLEPARKYKFLFTLDVTNASLVNISCVDDGEWMVDWVDSGNEHGDTFIK